MGFAIIAKTSRWIGELRWMLLPILWCRQIIYLVGFHDMHVRRKGLFLSRTHYRTRKSNIYIPIQSWNWAALISLQVSETVNGKLHAIVIWFIFQDITLHYRLYQFKLAFQLLKIRYIIVCKWFIRLYFYGSAVHCSIMLSMGLFWRHFTPKMYFITTYNNCMIVVVSA